MERRRKPELDTPSRFLTSRLVQRTFVLSDLPCSRWVISHVWEALMASVQIAQQWEDGTTTIITVSGKTSFPQALAEMKMTAVAAFIDVLDAMNDRVPD